MPMKILPMVNGTYLLERFPGKGGWTYAALPDIPMDRNNPFGWVVVKGFIDRYELSHYKLMPMGDGSLFLPVRKEVRKSIGKEAGDRVEIVLYKEDSAFAVPQEIRSCLELESPELLQVLENFREGEQKAHVDWIREAKTEETRVNRILEMMRRLERGLKLSESDREQAL